jgi:hypothetical protein
MKAPTFSRLKPQIEIGTQPLLLLPNPLRLLIEIEVCPLKKKQTISIIDKKKIVCLL